MFAIGSLKNGTNPEAGNQLNFNENIIMTKIPIQNGGIAMPNIEITLVTRSQTLFRFIAERIPAGIAINIENKIAKNVNSKVTGRRVFTISITGLRVIILRPKLPLNTFVIQV